MKILHIISSSGMYGAEAVILNLAHAFAGGPHSCAVAVFDNTDNPNHQLYDGAVAGGIEAYLIPCSGQADRSTISAIRALAAATAADIVHSHGYKADIYCFLALRRSKIPIVSTCHTWYDTDRTVTLYGKLDRLILRRFTRVVAVSEEVRRRLLGAGVKGGRIRIVRNGIDLLPFATARPSLREGLPPGALLIGLVGRLAWEKGIDNYLAAATVVLAEFPNVRFVVAGEGPDRDLLEATIDDLGLRSVVTLLGRRDDMPSVYASLDLLISASRQEGLPVALLEGMASGLPIVATGVGEVPTVIRDGCTGVIVPSGDTAALATAILSLLRDPNRRARFSAAGREVIAAEYSADRMASDYIRVYQEALTSTDASGRGTSIALPRPRIFMMDLWASIPYYTAYLSRALLQQGANLTVGSISYYLDPGCFSSRGIRLRPGLVNFVGRFRLPRPLRRILKLLESFLNLAALTVRFLFRSPDVIHVQFLPLLTSGFPLDLWFLHFCQARGSRIVLTVHDLLPHDTGLAHKAKFLPLYARVDALICHSASIRDRLVAEFCVPASKVSIIPHGPFFYDLPANNGARALSAFDIPSDRHIVLWQGIIFPYKGVDLLLKAWQQVGARITKACLVIAGTGQPALLEKIRAQVAGLGLKHVHLHFRFVTSDELVELYRAAVIVTYPYRAITTSGALATGLALGKAIVATNLPVFREVLKNRENALLVPPPSHSAEHRDEDVRDSQCVSSLADAICELLEDHPLRDRLAARNRAINFGDESWRSIARQTLDTYRTVLSRFQ
jgi:glycosyltransferase involved in cell wall biosynthesis